VSNGTERHTDENLAASNEKSSVANISVRDGDSVVTSFRVVDPADLPDPTRDPTVYALVLAAGEGTRFSGGYKLLADLGETTIVRRAVRTLRRVGCPTYVVVGHEEDRVREALDGLDVEFVRNPDYAAGKGTSLRVGVAALPADADAVLVALGDMPAVDEETIRTLLRAYAAGAGDALAAAYEGHRGNPVLFDRSLFDRLRTVDDEEGGREVLLGAANAALVETSDPGVRRDVDTREELRDLRG
jgi:molybdenum cofactor cytidylyltransferase